MNEKVISLTKAFEEDIAKASTVRDFEDLKVKYLGKKGPIASLMIHLKDVEKNQRPLFGKTINELKVSVTKSLDEKIFHSQKHELDLKLKSESIDTTLPGRTQFPGRQHPVTLMLEKVNDILIQMGFSIEYSPEMESEYYNYGGLNYPPDHPARDMQDTYYITDDILLRSHTTNIQQRILESRKPPIRIASPGKCYRNETISARSHVIFHQVDVLYIDKNVTFADLLATKKEFYTKLFGQDVELRVRPSYFPFVEPGMEVDIKCLDCAGKGCRLCKNTGWLEVAGAGMVHPEVLRQGGLDPEEYSGYAWGGGIERLILLMHGVGDIRLFLENDLRLLEQFS